MNFFEMSSRNSKGGRRKIKMSLLEIHQDDSSTNKNGLHWKEDYIINNLESIKGMPICAEFLDEDKSSPFGHGLTGIDSKENQPLFENSECVGHIETAYPTTIEINGVSKRILCGEGYVYQQRYPRFVEWLKENLKSGNVMSSIEIMGKPENDNKIMYENNSVDKNFRTPMVFDFTGTAILSIEPADNSALVLQMNSLNNSIDNFTKTQESEENTMDEKTLALIVDSVKGAVSETNSKNAEYENQIAELNAKLAEKDTEIAELNAKISTETERADKADTSVTELNSKIEALEAEVNECRKNAKIAEMNSKIADFSDEQKDYAKAEIEAFNADPMAVEINSIVEKIYTEIGKKALADAKEAEAQKIAEINSKTEEIVDVYGDILEANSSTEEEEISIY